MPRRGYPSFLRTIFAITPRSPFVRALRDWCQRVSKDAHTSWRHTGCLAIGALLAVSWNDASRMSWETSPTLLLITILFVLGGIFFAWEFNRKDVQGFLPDAHREVYENLSDPVFLLTQEGLIADLNRAGENFLGARAAEVLGKPAIQVLSRWTALVKHIQETMEGRPELELEIEGEKHFFELQSTTLHDNSGHITARLITLHDITELISTQAALKAAHEELEKREAHHAGELRTRDEALQKAEKSLQASQETARHLEALRQVSQDLIVYNDPDSLLNQIIVRAMKLMDGEAGGIYLYRADREILEWVVSVGDNVAPIGTVLEKDEGLSGKVWATCEPMVINDYKNWDGKTSKWPAISVSVIGVPIQWRDEFLGVLNIRSDSRTSVVYTEEDAALLTQFAVQAAIAIKNADLYEGTRRRLRRLSALREVDIAINSSLDITITLNILVDQVIRTLKVDAADVLLFNQYTKTLECAVRRGFQTGALQFTRLLLGEGFAGRAALERRTIHIPNLKEEKGALTRSKLLGQESFNGYFGVPLIAKGNVKGVLEVFHRTRLTPDSEWLDFLETLAGQAAIAIDNASLFKDLQHSHDDLTRAYDATIEGWARALELRDAETEGHSQRVTEMTMRLSQLLGISGEELLQIRRGALLHDIGKMGVPDSILLKPGKLTDEEWAIMRQHPVYAFEMLSPIAYLRPALDIPYCHHEKWDGTGYPRRLSETQIPISARIFAIVDVWDALSSKRPYRDAWPPDEVLAHLRAQSGKHFDPLVTKAFLKILEGT